MALEKTTYKTDDTLTAEKVNDIQDAIISLERITNTTENIALIQGSGQWVDNEFRFDGNQPNRITADLSSLNLSSGDKIGLKDYSTYVCAVGTNETASSWINGGYVTSDITLTDTNYSSAKVLLVKRTDNATMTETDFKNVSDLFFTTKEQKKISVSEKVVNKKSLNFRTYENPRNYVHISIDDVKYCLLNLLNNADKFTTVFSEPFFAKLKYLHEKYGAVFSLYVYDCSTTLANVTNKFAEEFTKNSDWLKFGFHSDTLYDYSSATAEVASTDYNNFITKIITLTGGVNSIDRIVRLNMYTGNENVCIALRDCNCGLYGFFTADAVRPSYYLSENQRNYLQNHSKLYDLTNGLVFYSTNMRLDWFNSDFSSDYDYAAPVKDNPYDELVYRYGLSTYCDAFQPLVIFTHEWDVYSSSYSLKHNIDRIEEVCKFANDYNFGFDFPMNRELGGLTSVAIS